MNAWTQRWLTGMAAGLLAGGAARADLEPGDSIRVTLRGVDVREAAEINGEYRIGDSGAVRLPMLERGVMALGLTPEQFARAAEGAYRDAGIYTAPAIEVLPLKGKEAEGELAVVSVGGHVRRAGKVNYWKGMTLLQAIDSVGGRDEFGSRNVLLIRDGRQYRLDFTKLRHKNVVLEPNDSLQIEAKGILDRWKGEEASLKALFGR